MENLRNGLLTCQLYEKSEAVVTPSLSGTAVIFTLYVCLVSIFTSATLALPGPRLPAAEAASANDGVGLVVSSCGTVTTVPKGVLQTPGFPKPFPVPLKCTWVIDASAGHAPGSSILVRLTQVFVTGGLRFESFARLDVSPAFDGRPWRFSGGHGTHGRVPSDGRQLIFDSDFGSSPPLEEVAWIRSASPYLVATLAIDTLEGSHIRDLGVLLDVYGLNMTYEVMPPPYAKGNPMDLGALGGRRRQGGKRRGGKDEDLDGGCSLLGCSVAGHCLANHDLSRYHCSCFEGHFGRRCQYSRQCNPMKNVTRCYNGGRCRHVGSTAIRCQCPKGFYGPLCESDHPSTGVKNHNSLVGGRDPGRRQKTNVKGSAVLRETKGCPNCQDFLCNYNGSYGSACQCQNKYKVNKGDRWLFEVKFKIANITAKTPVFQNVTLNELLEQQITTFLKSQNVTSEPRVSIEEDVSDNGEVSFSFRVGEEDGPKAREAMGVLVREKKQLGELLIASDSLELHEEPALLLLKVALDTANVAPGGGYTASCVAQGSPAMEFRWYKDGYLIDHTKASRHMWQRLLLDGRPNIYTAILRVTEVSAPEDMGVLWCHVSDRGQQQCGHVLIVESRGEHQQVIVQPHASTIHRGDNLTLACTSPSSVTDGNPNRVAYFLWRKNGSPLNTTVAKEVLEPLYPTGSLLRIYNAQKSAEYTCHIATNQSLQESSLHLKQPRTPLSWEGKIGHSSHVTVVHPGDPLCPRETSWGAAWPYTAVGQRAAVECPVGLSASFPKPLNGHGGANIPLNGTAWGLLPSNNVWAPLHGSEATRLCGATAKWEVPNFSNCYFHPVSHLLKKFRRLTHGYLTTSPEETLQEILDWLMSEDAWTIPKNTTSSNSLRDFQGPHSLKSSILLPGQIQQLLQLLEEIQFYLYNRMVVKDSSHGDIDMHISSYKLLKILDLLLLKYRDHFSNPKVSSRFINLALKQSTLWVYSLGIEFSVQYPSMASNVTVPDFFTTSKSLFALVDSLAYGRMRIPMPGVSIPAWFSDQVEVSLVARSARDPVSNVTDGLSMTMFSNPGATTIIPDESTKNILFSIVSFKNIGSNIPIKNQNRYHQMEYQLASHVISVDVYHKRKQKPHRSSMKSFLKNNKDWKEWDTSFRAEIPFNVALNFSIKPQRTVKQFDDGPDYLVACGQLTDKQVATTAELTSFWDVGISHSPSGSAVMCNFEGSGTFAAFIIGHKLKSSKKHEELSGLTSKYADSEGKISLDDDWWKALNGGHRNEGGTILITGFSTCFTLCLFTILINFIAISLPRREVQKKCPEDLPQVRRASSSGQHVSERGFNRAHVVISKKTVAKWNGDSVSVELYLQMQCCVAILILMGLLSYCCLITSPQPFFLAMALALEGSMLTGMGSLMGIVLILCCDISNETKVRQVASQACNSIMCVRSCGEQSTTTVASSVTPSKKDSSVQGWQFVCCKMAKLQNFLQSKLFIAGITSGIPVLSLMFCALLQRIFSSKKHSSWWLTMTSPNCVIFICLGIIMSILFFPVSICMMWQLHKNESQKEMPADEFARGKEADVNTITNRRIGVLRRALVIFSLIAIMEITSILYINFPDSSVIQWIFSISSLCLGMAIFISYAIKLDEPKKLCNNLLFSILSLMRDRR